MQQGIFGIWKSNGMPANNVPRKEHMRGPIPRQYVHVGCIQFEQISYNGFFLTVCKGDNCAKVHNAFYFIRNILYVEMFRSTYWLLSSLLGFVIFSSILITPGILMLSSVTDSRMN